MLCDQAMLSLWWALPDLPKIPSRIKERQMAAAFLTYLLELYSEKGKVICVQSR